MNDPISSSVPPPNTTLVTVTYGDRIDYLHALLQRAFCIENVGRAVIVSNASTSDISLLEEQWAPRLRVISLETNTGSANGYAVGIAAALADEADYIWLMDDDNAPMRGALSALHDRLATSSAVHGMENAAVLGFRPTHQSAIAQGIEARHAYPPRSSFLGFHYRQIAFKIWRRIRPAPGTHRPASIVSMPYAPYGGLLASAMLFKRIGLPKCELVLYADDTEYTYRITAGGGVIELVTCAEIEDLEHSWYLREAHPNNFLRLLHGRSDFRAYYGIRNLAWFERNVWRTSWLEYALNSAIYMILLKYFALRSGQPQRYRLLRDAIREGRTNQLGLCDRFPL